MGDSEGFVARWSRLKRTTEREQAARGAIERSEGEISPEKDEAKPQPNAPNDIPFDVASLPSIDTITGSTDIRGFLNSGVPAELTRSALRRAWTQDPAIRDFIGIAENQWDFTDPNAMAGFGPLDAADDVGQLVSQAMGKLPEQKPVVAAADEPPAPTQEPDSAETAEQKHSVQGSQREPELTASSEKQDVAGDVVENVPRRHVAHRGHGGALPR